MIRYSQDLVLLRGCSLRFFFLYIYIVGILHIERCFIDLYHLLTVYSWSYTVFVLKGTFPKRLFSILMHLTRENSLLTKRSPRFVTFTHPVLIFKALKCEFTLMAAIKMQFCRSPDLFLQYFLWHWELYGSRGLNPSEEHILRNVLRTERLLKYMPHKHNWNVLVRLLFNMLFGIYRTNS